MPEFGLAKATSLHSLDAASTARVRLDARDAHGTAQTGFAEASEADARI